jgi:uncharacterized protein (TIRG00374 family)
MTSEPSSVPQTPQLPESSSGDEKGSRPINLSFKNILWPLLLSLVVLVLIGYFTFDHISFKSALSTINPWFLLAALGTVVFRVIFGAWRFSFISRGQLGFRQGLRGQLAWDFFSNVTPAALGGGPFAALYVARDSRMKIGETTALVLFTILLDQLWSALMIPVILISAIYFAVIPSGLGSIGAIALVGYFLAMLSWTGILGYATLFRPELLQRVSDRIFRIRFLKRFRERVATEMTQMSECARILRSQPPSFFVNAFLLTAGTWIPRYLLPVFIVLSVFTNLEAFLFFIRGITLMVSAFIVPTPGGAGGIEGLYALFLGPMMPKALVAPTLFMWRFLGYYIFVAMGAFIFRLKDAGRHLAATRTPPRSTTFSHVTVPAEEREPEFADSEE